MPTALSSTGNLTAADQAWLDKLKVSGHCDGYAFIKGMFGHEAGLRHAKRLHSDGVTKARVLAVVKPFDDLNRAAAQITGQKRYPIYSLLEASLPDDYIRVNHIWKSSIPQCQPKG
jgi:hypothetical protein